jgi:NADH-quinone oxidoreductase subunit J
MGFYEIMFYLLAAMTISSAVMVITRRNPVHSAIFLIITLLGVALLFLQMNAEFLAAVQIIVYIGGIMVLFLFVIMLVSIDVSVRQVRFNSQWLLGGFTSFVLLVLLAGAVSLQPSRMNLPQAPAVAVQPNVEMIGDSLFQSYMLPFEVASLLLLVAMVGAVLMGKRRKTEE